MTEPCDHRLRVFYVGLEPATIFPLLASQRIFLVGLATINGINYRTFNPFDKFLQAIYFQKVNFRWMACALPWLSFAMSKRARRYAKYVSACALHRLKTFDIEEDSDALRTQDFDILLCNAWDRIPQWLIERCKIGAINIHPSLLPQYRGAVPTLCTLANQDKLSAVTYLTIEQGYDTGNIICQIPFEIKGEDDFQTMEHKIQLLINNTVCGILIGFSKGLLQSIPQDEKLASYTPRYENYRKIDTENEGCQEIFNKVGLYPWIDPGLYCYIHLMGKDIPIKCVRPNKGSHRKHSFNLKFLKLNISAKDGSFSVRLFRDVGFRDSLYIVRKWRGPSGDRA